MHEADPRGSLLINGVRPNEKQLAALVGIKEKEAVEYIAELETNGVFSRQDDGTIYSRRIHRDEERAERDKANGKMGGNPRLNGGVNPPDKPAGNGGDKAHILEARIQKEDYPADAGSSSVGYAFEFGCIRLRKKDFDAWTVAFCHIDLWAELIGLEPWAAQQSNWFIAVSQALAKKNREAKLRLEQLKQPQPAYKWASGMEGIT